MPSTVTQHEVHTVSSAMVKYGGSFIQNIGRALQNADWHNVQKIRETWPEDWERYLQLGQSMPE